MKDLLSDLDRWFSAGDPVALATVIQTWGASPRGIGAKMVMTQDRKMSGSVSGGCVEGVVVKAGADVIQTGKPRLVHFVVSDETAWNVGLACGGQMDVFVQPLDGELYRGLREAFLGGRSFTISTIIRAPEDLLGCVQLFSGRGSLFSTIPGPLGLMVAGAARSAFDESKSRSVILGHTGNKEIEAFVEMVEAQLVLVIVGAVHSAVALTRLARVMGFRTIVIDPRRAFGNATRFQEVDWLIQKWPEEAFAQLQVTPRTAIAVLTHDPMIDDPAVMLALRSPAFYVGALGSPAAQARRRARLKQAGLDDESLSRLRGPVGLTLGGRTPEEIALSVLAEIVSVQHKATA